MSKREDSEKEPLEIEESGEEKKAEQEQPEKEKVIISRQEYAGLKAKENEVNEKMLRLQAEVENIKKRLERDRLEFIRFSNEKIIAELVPFIDDFQRAFAAADKSRDFNVLHKGVEMILKHLLELLKASRLIRPFMRRCCRLKPTITRKELWSKNCRKDIFSMTAFCVRQK